MHSPSVSRAVARDMGEISLGPQPCWFQAREQLFTAMGRNAAPGAEHLCAYWVLCWDMRGLLKHGLGWDPFRRKGWTAERPAAWRESEMVCGKLHLFHRFRPLLASKRMCHHHSESNICSSRFTLSCFSSPAPHLLSNWTIMACSSTGWKRGLVRIAQRRQSGLQCVVLLPL